MKNGWAASASHTLLRALTVSIYESHESPGRPGYYVAMPDQRELISPGDTPFPEGEATLLRAIALWHGAKDCVWRPNHDNGGRGRSTAPVPAEPALA